MTRQEVCSHRCRLVHDRTSLRRRCNRRHRGGSGLRIRPSTGMTTSVVLAVVGVLVTAVAASSATPPVTITSARQFFDHDVSVAKTIVSGALANGAGGESIEIRARHCGTPGARIVGIAQTAAGGTWTETVDWGGSAYFRARWKSQDSAPFLVRTPLKPVIWSRRGALFAKVITPDRRVRGRKVVLQRETTAGWIRVQSARLVVEPRAVWSYIARFVVRTRGQTLRVLIPSETARPCHFAAISEEWHS